MADIDNVDSSEDRGNAYDPSQRQGTGVSQSISGRYGGRTVSGMMAVSSDDPTDMEEERRLCYVGITRAKKELVITAARKRMTHGETRVL